MVEKRTRRLVRSSPRLLLLLLVSVDVLGLPLKLALSFWWWAAAVVGVDTDTDTDGDGDDVVVSITGRRRAGDDGVGGEEGDDGEGAGDVGTLVGEADAAGTAPSETGALPAVTTPLSRPPW